MATDFPADRRRGPLQAPPDRRKARLRRDPARDLLAIRLRQRPRRAAAGARRDAAPLLNDGINRLARGAHRRAYPRVRFAPLPPCPNLCLDAFAHLEWLHAPPPWSRCNHRLNSPALRTRAFRRPGLKTRKTRRT